MAIHDTPPTSGRSRGREIALNVGAIAGLICVLAAVASFFFGIKPLIFRSGSMSPDIPTGALALAKATPAADLAVGDVVSVENGQGTRITHRVHDIVSNDGTTTVLILKGDANKDADISPYTVTEADRVFFSVPGLGYAVSWLSSPAAIFLGGAFVGGLMVLAFGPAANRKGDDSDSDGGAGGTPGAHEVVEWPVAHAHSGFDASTEQPRAPGFSMRRALPARTLMVFGAVGVTALGATAVGTTAAFTDAAVASSSFTANPNFYPTPVVTSTSCKNTGTVGFRDAIISWTSLGNTPLGVPYQYVVKVRRDSNPNEVKTTYDMGTATSKQVNFDDTAKGWILEVHTKNGSNVSTGWRGQGVWTSTIYDTYCSGGESNVANPSSENPQSVGETAEVSRAALRMPSPEAAVATTTTQAPSSTTAAATSDATTTAPESTTESSTTTASTTTTTAPESTTQSTTTAVSTTTASATTAEHVTTTTPAPATTTAEEPVEEAATVPSGGDLAIANTSTSGDYTATVSGTTATITDKSGAQVFVTTVGKKAMVQWAPDADQLWIIDGTKLSVVDPVTGSEKSVDPASDTVPAEVAALVTK